MLESLAEQADILAGFALEQLCEAPMDLTARHVRKLLERGLAEQIVGNANGPARLHRNAASDERLQGVPNTLRRPLSKRAEVIGRDRAPRHGQDPEQDGRV